jgi:signal transduction histidine kinase
MLHYQSDNETSNRQLKESNETKDKLFSIIAHDLRTPASNLLFLSDTLIRKGAKMSEEEKSNYLELMNKAANTSNNLLNNLLQWSRIQSNHITVNPVCFSTKTVIDAVIEQTQLQAEKKAVSIVDASADQYVKADTEMVTTVLRNLVSNAIKFSYPGQSVVIDAAQLPDNMVQLSVADTGTGMTPDIISTLFEVDKNKTTEGTGHEKGTGLGLILCKEFLERNSGTLRIESEPDKGSKFIFTLPQGD